MQLRKYITLLLVYSYIQHDMFRPLSEVIFKGCTNSNKKN